MINAPNLHLFAFQLNQAVNLKLEAFAPEQNFLWNNGDAIVKAITGQDLHISQQIDVNKLPDVPKVDLLLDAKIIDDNPTIQFQDKLALDNGANLPIEGFAHPLHFKDSYGLSLTVGGAEENADGTPTEDVDIAIFRLFQDSRRLYQELNKACREIETEVDNLPQPESNDTETDLTDLKAKLKKLPHLNLKYTRLLRNLEEYHNTIAINADNYALRVQQICDIIGIQEINFLAAFFNKSCPFFQQQITADLGYFRHASGLLDRATESIRGIVEIEQAERDRQKEATDKIRDAKLQNTIQAVGVGLGVGTGVAGIFSQTFPLIIEKEWTLLSKDYPLLPPHPFLISFPMSLLLGAFLGWQAWRFCRKRLDSKLPKETLPASNPHSLPASPNPEFLPLPTQKTGQKVEGSASLDN